MGNDDEKLVSFIVDLIKGIHLIMFKAGYGRASTTTICNLFGTLIKKDTEKFIDLYNWVATNGGNYYIEPNITFNDAKKAEEGHIQYIEEERLRMENMHTEAVAKKQHIRDLHV